MGHVRATLRKNFCSIYRIPISLGKCLTQFFWRACSTSSLSVRRPDHRPKRGTLKQLDPRNDRMRELLQRAIAEVEKLPVETQDAIATRLLAEVTGERADWLRVSAYG